MLEVSAGVIIADSKILCFQKGESKYPYLSYKFEFPGGKIEKGETPEQALVRELSEELEMDVSNSRIEPLCETFFNYPDFSVRIHSFLIFMKKVNYKLSEHRKAVWSTIDTIEDLDWMPADLEIVKILGDYHG